MPLVPAEFGSLVPVEGYGPGFWRAAGRVIRGAMLVTGRGATEWGGYDDPAPVLALAGGVDVLFLGTGAALVPPPAAFRAAVEAAGIGIEPMASPTAARSYNVTLAEGRRVAAALLPMPEPGPPAADAGPGVPAGDPA